MKITDVKAYVIKPRYPDNAGAFEGELDLRAHRDR